MGIEVKLRVSKPSVVGISADELWEQNQDWASNMAWRAVHTLVAVYPEHKEDWQSEALLHLWQVRGSYDAGRGAGNWQRWAYAVLQNKVHDLIDRERNRRRFLVSADVLNTARVSRIKDKEHLPTMDAVMVDALKARLIKEARAMLDRDLKALDYLVKNGDGRWARSEVGDLLGVDSQVAEQTFLRIRAAMLETGIGEVQP